MHSSYQLKLGVLLGTRYVGRIEDEINMAKGDLLSIHGNRLKIYGSVNRTYQIDVDEPFWFLTILAENYKVRSMRIYKDRNFTGRGRVDYTYVADLDSYPNPITFKPANSFDAHLLSFVIRLRQLFKGNGGTGKPY
jgi:hypothetical protein